MWIPSSLRLALRNDLLGAKRHSSRDPSARESGGNLEGLPRVTCGTLRSLDGGKKAQEGSDLLMVGPLTGGQDRNQT